MKTVLPNFKFYPKILYIVFFLFGLSLSFGQAEYGFVEGENFKNAVVYKTVDGKDVVMDMFYPDAEKLSNENPWVVFIHGGGWAGGSIDNIYKSAFIGTMKKLVNNGVVVASIGYRLAKSPVTSYESMQDCKDAARYLLQNATEHKLSTENYALWGGSAGGHLALVTGLVPDAGFPGDPSLSSITPNYKGVVAFYPFTSCLNEDLRPGSIFEDGTLFERLLGGSVEEKPELARALSPTEFLDENSIPVLLVHGENDTTLPVINSTYMMEVAVEKNANVEFVSVKNAEHSFGGSNISPTLDEISNETIKFILTKFGYVEQEIDYVEPENPVDPGTPVFEPVESKIYNVYNPRWDRRLAADGGNELTVMVPSEEGNAVQWKFTPVSDEAGYYFMDCVGGGDKPRISADATDVSKMVANTEEGDGAKWKFDYYDDADGRSLFWITNKNGRRIRGWGDHVDIVATSSSGTYTRFAFSESNPSLSTVDNMLKEPVSVFPIPTSGILNINIKEPLSANVTLFDVSGKAIISKKIHDVSNQLDLSNVTSGFYFLKIQTGNMVFVKNLVKD